MSSQEKSSRDNLLPPNPRNDAVAILHARPGHQCSPGPTGCPATSTDPDRRQSLQILLIISFVLVPIVLFLPNILVALAVLAGFLASVFAFVTAVRAARHPTAVFSFRLKLLGLATAATVFHGWACLETNSRWRDVDRTIVTGSLLRQIAQGVETYRNQYDVAPTDLNQLVASNLYSERWLLLPTDKEGWQNFFAQGRASPSITFVPAAAARDSSPKKILAYERGPWSSAELRLFPEYKHSVVFADGTVEKLTSAELTAALAKPPTTQPRP